LLQFHSLFQAFDLDDFGKLEVAFWIVGPGPE
ncbi:MAG: hypothetical protein JWN45_2967, partial [Acidobacteriaceae bacterium]|nr:hypothetical protein [Acidobacteriaceae bacterium]